MSAPVPASPRTYNADALRVLLRGFGDAERKYVGDLDSVIAMYHGPLTSSRAKGGRLSLDVERLVFQNLSDIAAFAKVFLRNFESMMQDVTDVADVDVGSMFVFMEKKFDMYAEYVNGLPRAALALRRLRAAPSPTIAVAGGAPLPQPIAVPAYFLQHPLRRVLQYGLFLRSLVAKQLAGTVRAKHAELALVRFSPLVTAARACESTLAKQSKLFEFIDRLVGDDADTYEACQYVHSGILFAASASSASSASARGKRVCVWLLRDRLVVTTPRLRNDSKSVVPAPNGGDASSSDEGVDPLASVVATSGDEAADDDMLSSKNVVYVLKSVLFLSQVRRVSERPVAAGATLFGVQIEPADGEPLVLFAPRRELQSDWVRRLNVAVSSRDTSLDERPAVPEPAADDESEDTNEP